VFNVCRKLVIAQKYSAEVQPNFGTRSAPSAKTSAEHYKGMFGAPLITAITITVIIIIVIIGKNQKFLLANFPKLTIT